MAELTALAGAGWTAIVPIKPPAAGKSRLSADPRVRESLARAMAIDTLRAVTAAHSVAGVLVVTEDEDVAEDAARLSPLVTPLVIPPYPGIVHRLDSGSEPPLNAALARAAAFVGIAHNRVAVSADLPALRPVDLEYALQRANAVARGVVADASRSGSSMLTARSGVPWRSAFGRRSFTRHVASGHVPLPIPRDSSLHFDVDTVEDLSAAHAHGVGPATARATDALAATI